MAYDPFARGEHPVGVRTVELVDAARRRTLATEVWYPAAAAHAGEDTAPQTRDTYVMMEGFPRAWQQARRDATPAAPAAGRFPLAVFSHGFAGHRRQSTFLCTHLASHGWAVVATDHGGNTFMDVATSGRLVGRDVWRASMAARPAEVILLIDAAADGRLGVAADTTRVAMTGHSFGGWTAVRAVAAEPRIAAVAALAPAIGHPQLREALDLGWTRPVPTLVIAADRDAVLPLDDLTRVFCELPPPALLLVLEATDHMHFCDGARQIHELFRSMPAPPIALIHPLPPFADLAPARHAYDAACGLVLAHLDGTLRDRPEARAFAAGDLVAALRGRGIAAHSGVCS
jgi:predicted dienelactone hydrolase